MDPSRGDSRYNLNYSMSSIGLSLADQADMYGNPAAVAALGGRPPSGGLIQTMGGSNTGVGFSTRPSNLMTNTTQCQSLANSTANNAGNSGQQRGLKRAGSDCYDDHHRAGSGNMSSQTLQGLESCGGGNGQAGQQQQQAQTSANVPDVVDDSYTAIHNKKSPPANGKKTKGRVKIKMEYIDNKLRRYTTFSKRKTGIMKKAYELSTLTGTQVMLLVASETGHVYTFATRKLQPMITSEAGKQLIQTCLNSPDPPSVGGGDQRMSATGFEETELSYNIADEDSKDGRSPLSSINESEDSSDADSPGPTIGPCKKAVDITPLDKNSTLEKHHGAVSSLNERVRREDQPSFSLNSKSEAYPTLNVTLQNEDKNSEAVSSFDNLLCPASTLSNIPHEVLLQLIQSGHLQLHTEQDGSGHQYVAIPLSSSAANLIKTNKDISSGFTEKGDRQEQSNRDGYTTSKVPNTTGSGIIIKEELE